MSEPDYESYTRQHYRDQVVATDYALRLRWWRSPADWAIGRLERRAVARALTALGARSSDCVVDVPAGTGKLTAWLIARSGRYVALDISEQMLAHVGGGCTRAVADATALPLADAGVDVVVSLRLLHRVPAPVATDALGEGVRVARRGLVVSYAGVPSSRRLYTLLRVAGRRSATKTTPHTPAEFALLVARAGGVVVADRSISFGLTSERVVAVRPRGQPLGRP